MVDVLDPDINYYCNTRDCRFYAHDELNSDNYASGSLYIMNFNIRSVSKNIDEFKIFMSSSAIKFSIIALTETWLNDGDEFLNYDGYDAFHSIRDKRRGGGVTLLVDRDLNASVFSECTSM